jgi:uncharacterized protein (TIGR00730 family)
MPLTSDTTPDTTLTPIRRVCVFCGSSAGEGSPYLDAVTRLGRTLAERGIGLVYGGSRMGLMGRLAQTVLDAGGEVTGIMPRALMNREVAHSGIQEMIFTESMHDRKSEMVARSDAFLAAPGGLGTLEAFFEVLTWGQLGFHRKPCGILDVDGYYRALGHLLEHAAHEGFIQSSHRDMVLIDDSPGRLLDRFASYDPPEVPRWLRSGET